MITRQEGDLHYRKMYNFRFYIEEINENYLYK